MNTRIAVGAERALGGLQSTLGGSSPARSILSFEQLLSAATTCCGQALQHRDFLS